VSLESALVDQARTLQQVAAAAGRVRGQTRLGWVSGPWFGAMLQLPQGGAAPDASQGRKRVVTQPTLLFDVADENGDPVEVTAAMRIEVSSERFGDSVWEPTGDPEPLGSLYEVIGYQVTLRKVTDHEFTPVGA
jgi:hypothetical protein